MDNLYPYSSIQVVLLLLYHSKMVFIESLIFLFYRLIPVYQHHHQDDTGSETESIPFDDELHSTDAVVSTGHPRQPAQAATENQAGLQEHAISLASSVMSNLINNQMTSSIIGGKVVSQ